MNRADVVRWLTEIVDGRAPTLAPAEAERERNMARYICAALETVSALTPFESTPAAHPEVPPGFLYKCRSCEFYEQLAADTAQAIQGYAIMTGGVPLEWAGVKQGSWTCVGTPDSPFNVARLLAGHMVSPARWDWSCECWRLAQGRTYRVEPLAGKEAGG